MVPKLHTRQQQHQQLPYPQAPLEQQQQNSPPSAHQQLHLPLSALSLTAPTFPLQTPCHITLNSSNNPNNTSNGNSGSNPKSNSSQSKSINISSNNSNRSSRNSSNNNSYNSSTSSPRSTNTNNTKAGPKPLHTTSQC